MIPSNYFIYQDLKQPSCISYFASHKCVSIYNELETLNLSSREKKNLLFYCHIALESSYKFLTK